MSKKITKTEFNKATTVVKAYVKQESAIAAEKAKKHGKAAMATAKKKTASFLDSLSAKLKK